MIQLAHCSWRCRLLSPYSSHGDHIDQSCLSYETLITQAHDYAVGHEVDEGHGEPGRRMGANGGWNILLDDGLKLATIVHTPLSALMRYLGPDRLYAAHAWARAFCRPVSMK
jgi:hypothetical protein